MSEPTVTVVVPAHDAEATVGATIRSVLGQTRPDFEVVVVDDGSTDETAAVVESLGDDRVRLLRQENAGVAAARNAALAAARGRFLSMLDSDDLWLPRYLETLVGALESDPQASVAYTDAWVLDDRARRIGRRTAMASQNPPLPPPSDPSAFLRELLARNFVYTAVTLRRTALDDVGPFDKRFSPAEDYELWLRLAARKHRFVRPAGIHALYRDRAQSLSADETVMWRAVRRAFESVEAGDDLPPDLRELARDRLRALDAALRALDRGGLRGTLVRARASIPALRSRFGGRLAFRSDPPAEVAAAFPDLRAL